MKLKDIPGVMLGKKERIKADTFNLSPENHIIDSYNQSQEEQGEVRVELDRDMIENFLEKNWNHLFSPEENYLGRFRFAQHLSDNLPSILKVKK